ncbi:MAG: ATP-binding protein [Chitinophagales bacterium]
MFANKEFYLQLSSHPQNIRLVEPYVLKVKKRFNIDDEVYFNILLVLTEAVNNCILHGNQEDPRKHVHIRMNPKQNALYFVIRDEGEGFNPERLPDPTQPDRLACANGRGVFLMRQLSNNVQYSNDGRQVEISFLLN